MTVGNRKYLMNAGASGQKKSEQTQGKVGGPLLLIKAQGKSSPGDVHV